jgi:hypothetical protein
MAAGSQDEKGKIALFVKHAKIKTQIRANLVSPIIRIKIKHKSPTRFINNTFTLLFTE